jgi:NAD(P)-dependent dehydrogenase (short-subunit alcohol dehydrogenase family)
MSTRAAIVTGAARGIGAATVRALASDGWAVLAVDLCADDPALPYALGTRAELDAVVLEAQGLAGDPTRVAALAADVRDVAALAAAVASVSTSAVAWLSRGTPFRPCCGDPSATRDGPWRWRRRRHPWIARAGLCCAAKAGVAGLIRALTVELRGNGVTANAVSLGSTDTPILAESARLYDLPEAEVFAAQQPLERLFQPWEVAA